MTWLNNHPTAILLSSIRSRINIITFYHQKMIKFSLFFPQVPSMETALVLHFHQAMTKLLHISDSSNLLWKDIIYFLEIIYFYSCIQNMDGHLIKIKKSIFKLDILNYKTKIKICIIKLDYDLLMIPTPMFLPQGLLINC